MRKRTKPRRGSRNDEKGTTGRCVDGDTDAGRRGAALTDDQGAHASINYEDSTVYLNDSRDYGSRRDNDIDHITPDAGVMHVQQNNGSANEIGAASSVQYGINGGNDVDTSASVKALTGLNYTVNEGGLRTNDVHDSFNDFSGVLAVQQNNGDNNSIGIAMLSMATSAAVPTRTSMP